MHVDIEYFLRSTIPHIPCFFYKNFKLVKNLDSIILQDSLLFDILLSEKFFADYWKKLIAYKSES